MAGRDRTRPATRRPRVGGPGARMRTESRANAEEPGPNPSGPAHRNDATLPALKASAGIFPGFDAPPPLFRTLRKPTARRADRWAGLDSSVDGQTRSDEVSREGGA